MWNISHSTEKPDLIDTTSSQVYNYIRKNINKSINEDNVTMYEYEEAKIKKEDSEITEFLIEVSTLAEIAEAQAMYTALMTDTLIEEE